MISNYHTAADVVPGPGQSNYNYTFDDDPVSATTTKKGKKKRGGGWGRAFGRKSGKVSPADHQHQHLHGQLADRVDSLSFSTDNSSNAGQETNSSASSAVFRMLEDEGNKLSIGKTNNKRGGYSVASSAHSTTSGMSGSNYSTDGSLLGTKLIPSANNSVASSSMGSLEGEKFLNDSVDLQNHPGLEYLKSNTNQNHSTDGRQQNYQQQQRRGQYQQDSSSKQAGVHPNSQGASSSASPLPPPKQHRDVPLADDLIPTWFCGVELPNWLVLSI